MPTRQAKRLTCAATRPTALLAVALGTAHALLPVVTALILSHGRQKTRHARPRTRCCYYMHGTGAVAHWPMRQHINAAVGNGAFAQQHARPRTIGCGPCATQALLLTISTAARVSSDPLGCVTLPWLRAHSTPLPVVNTPSYQRGCRRAARVCTTHSTRAPFAVAVCNTHWHTHGRCGDYDGDSHRMRAPLVTPSLNSGQQQHMHGKCNCYCSATPCVSRDRRSVITLEHQAVLVAKSLCRTLLWAARAKSLHSDARAYVRRAGGSRAPATAAPFALSCALGNNHKLTCT